VPCSFSAALIGNLHSRRAEHASYIATWIKVLKEDKREIFRAAADAQKIADLALSFHPDYAATIKAEMEETAAPMAVQSAQPG